MKILATAYQKGSAAALAPVIKELQYRNHEVKVYATGNKGEVTGFGDVKHEIITPSKEDYNKLVKGYNIVITGLSGYTTHDGEFLRAAIKKKIPTIAIQDQDAAYKLRLGENPDDLPTILSLMNQDCIDKIKYELNKEMADEIIKRAKIIGWTAFDHYAEIKNSFTEQDREKFLYNLKLNPEQKIYSHFTQNVHPDTNYTKSRNLDFNEWIKKFNYEMDVTKAVFRTASDLSLKLIVKPHGGEKYEKNFTEELVKKHGFVYIPAEADTKKLMLSSYSISAGRSTCLTEGCLFDKNTGGIFPDLTAKDISPFPAAVVEAIPYTFDWEGIPDILGRITSKEERINKTLEKKRKRFSVDGNASKRLVDIIESLR